jgi:cyclin-dependent kinase-like
VKETGELVAIKRFKESDRDEQVRRQLLVLLGALADTDLACGAQVRKTAVREVKVLRSVRHDNIVSLLDVFRQNGKLYLVFEYVERTGEDW